MSYRVECWRKNNHRDDAENNTVVDAAGSNNYKPMDIFVSGIWRVRLSMSSELGISRRSIFWVYVPEDLGRTAYCIKFIRHHTLET